MTGDGSTSFFIENAAVSKRVQENGLTQVVVRGDIALDSLEIADRPEYQRMILDGEKQESLKEAIMGIGVPDVIYGLHGADFIPHLDGTVEVRGHVSIIDGLQRTSAARALRKAGRRPQLGVKLCVNTDDPLERAMFSQHNRTSTPLSPNVTIFNEAGVNPAVKVLVELAEGTPDFVLYKRIQWDQRQAPNELISARSMSRALGALHGRVAAMGGSDIDRILKGLRKIVAEIGAATFAANATLFFAIVDDCFSITNIQNRRAAPQIKESFLRGLAQMFSAHSNFWKDDSLSVNEDPYLARLRQFKIDAPIQDLAGKEHGASSIYRWLTEHMDGRRSEDSPYRLQRWQTARKPS